MEKQSSGQKPWLWIAVGLALVGLVGGAFALFNQGGNPYQERLAEIKRCLQDELGVEVVYTKELPENFATELPLETRILFRVFDRTTLPRLNGEVTKDAWRNYQVSCALDGRTGFEKRNFLAKAKLYAAQGQPLLVTDLYNEATLKFEDQVFKEKLAEAERKALEEAARLFNKALKEGPKSVFNLH